MIDFPAIEQFVREFMAKMGWPDVSIVVKLDPETPTVLDISLSAYDTGHLIGAGGENLAHLQHLLAVLLFKRFSLTERVRVDVNNYRKERDDYLREMARSIAQKVSVTKQPLILPPMSSYERRLVHVELASRPDVVTESQGEGFERQVVVKPYN